MVARLLPAKTLPRTKIVAYHLGYLSHEYSENARNQPRLTVLTTVGCIGCEQFSQSMPVNRAELVSTAPLAAVDCRVTSACWDNS